MKGDSALHSSSNAIQTVKSTIASSELGYCQSHEHLFISSGQSAKLVASLQLDDFTKSLSELAAYQKNGGISLVDAQPVGCSRMAHYLYAASVQTGVNIIASTGFHKLVFYPQDHWLHAFSESNLVNLFVSEIISGMFVNCDTSPPIQRIAAQAGVIKTASDLLGPHGEYRKLFSAAAEAAKLTGVSILSHTELGKSALEQIKLFTASHVPIDSLIICHLDRDLTDMGYLREVAQTGVYMEFDTIGRFKYHSDQEEALFILQMVEYGFEDRILIGLDTTNERMKSYGGPLGLDYILTSFIPTLKSVGLTDDVIKKFTISNPAQAFSIKKP